MSVEKPEQVKIEVDEEDPRLKQFEGWKKTFNGGQGPIRFLSDQRNEKWLRQRKAKAGPTNDKETQKKQIEIAKNLILTWDADGEGSLSPAEIIKAFVSIGLS